MYIQTSAIFYTEPIISSIPQIAENTIDYLLLTSNTEADAYSLSGSGENDDPYYFDASYQLDNPTITDNIRGLMYVKNVNKYCWFDRLEIDFTSTYYTDSTPFYSIYIENSANLYIDSLTFNVNPNNMYNYVFIYLVECENITIRNINFVDRVRANNIDSNTNPAIGIYTKDCTNISIVSNYFNYVLLPIYIENQVIGIIHSNRLNYTIQSATFYNDTLINIQESTNITILHNTYDSPTNTDNLRIQNAIYLNQTEYIIITEHMIANAYYGIYINDTKYSRIIYSYFDYVGVELNSSTYTTIQDSTFTNNRYLWETDRIGLIMNKSEHNLIEFNFFADNRIGLQLQEGGYNEIRSNYFISSSGSGLFLNDTTHNDIHNNLFGSTQAILKNTYNLHIKQSGLNTFYENVFEDAFTDLVKIENSMSNLWAKMSFGFYILGNWWSDLTDDYPESAYAYRDDYTYLIDYIVDPSNLDENNIDEYPLRINPNYLHIEYVVSPEDIVQAFTITTPYIIQWFVRTDNSTEFNSMMYRIFENNVLKKQGMFFDMLDWLMISYTHNTYEVGVYEYRCEVFDGQTTIIDTMRFEIFNDIPQSTCVFNESAYGFNMTLYDKYHFALEYAIKINGEWFLDWRTMDSELLDITPYYVLAEDGEYNITIYINDFNAPLYEKVYLFTIGNDYTWIWWLVGGIGIGGIGFILVIRFFKCSQTSKSVICDLQTKIFKEKLS